MSKKHGQLERLMLASSAYREQNDCTVIAAALVTGATYEQAHTACAMSGDRMRGRGMRWWRHGYAVLDDLGHRAEPVSLAPLLRRKGSGLTGCTVAQYLPRRGRYLVQYRGHLAAVVNGELLDWTKGRRHRVIRLWKVEPAQQQ